jgi:NOL1/NOP2/sun family putative RNA methylase
MSTIDKYVNKYKELFKYSPTSRARELSIKYGFLDYMVERYLDIFKEKTEDFLESCNYPLIKSIRCNTLKIDCNELIRRLTEKGFTLEKVNWINYGLIVKNKPKRPSLGSTVEYLKGYYYIQSLASMIPAEVLRPNKEDVVLDMAAAPGSKTTQMAQLMGNEGLIIAVEKYRTRIKSLMSNINRLGVSNTIIANIDARDLINHNLSFSKILLDAPCSGEGLIPEDSGRKTRTKPEDLYRLSIIQLELLDVAYKLLQDNGDLVYSTCSIAPEENEFVINYAIEELGMKTMRIDKIPGDEGIIEFNEVAFSEDVKNCIRLYPHKHKTEGFFICHLKK